MILPMVTSEHAWTERVRCVATASLAHMRRLHGNVCSMQVLMSRGTGWHPEGWMHGPFARKKKNNQIGHHDRPRRNWPQRPYAQGRTRAKQDQVQASAPGQNQTRSIGGATTHGRRTRQAGESVPT